MVMLNTVPAVCVMMLAKAKCVSEPANTLNVMGFPVPAASGPPDPVAVAVIVTEPATLPVTVSVATPAAAVLAPSPVTLPAPEDCVNVTLKVLSAPVVTVLPLAS